MCARGVAVSIPGAATRAAAIAHSMRTIASSVSLCSRLSSPLATGCRVGAQIGEPEGDVASRHANCVNVEDCGPQRWGQRRCRVVEHQPETSPRGDPSRLSRFIAPFAASAAGAVTASAAPRTRRSTNPAVMDGKVPSYRANRFRPDAWGTESEGRHSAHRVESGAALPRGTAATRNTQPHPTDCAVDGRED
jgi:hypothetical protein